MARSQTATKKPANSSQKPKRPRGLTVRDDQRNEFTGVAATMIAIRRHLDVSVHEFNDLVELQLFPTGITLDAARIRYIRHLRAVARGEVGDGSNAAAKVEGRQARSLLAAAQREKIELQLAQQRGENVRIADVARILNGAFTSARSRLLAVATTHAQELSVLRRPVEIEVVLRKAIKEVLDDTAEIGAKLTRGAGAAHGSR